MANKGHTVYTVNENKYVKQDIFKHFDIKKTKIYYIIP